MKPGARAVVGASREQSETSPAGDGAGEGLVVKICGLRSVAAAVAAVEAGADLLGFNFAPVSKRRVSPEVAREAIARCRELHSGVEAAGRGGGQRLLSRRPAMIGIFVNQDASEIRALSRRCLLDAVQLSGDESADQCRAVGAETGLPVIKAVRLGQQSADEDGGNVAYEAYNGAAGVAALLVDAPGTGSWGGTGLGWEWARAAPLARRGPLLLAGGLNAGNVGNAVAAVWPWGVDVASGVETAGETDALKVAAFISRAKQGHGASGAAPPGAAQADEPRRPSEKRAASAAHHAAHHERSER